MKINICHLYPDVLNLYGDRGNIICMKQRLKWRGVECEVTELPIGETSDFSGFDLFFIGGGQDFEQGILLDDLKTGKATEIKSAIEDGKTFLCVCGGYQLLGHYYETYDGKKYDFLGVLDYYTKGSPKRMIGNYAFALGTESGGSTVVGFENHSGKTFLSDKVSPLGEILKGYGNNGKDKTEGVRYKNVFGTYSHGPVLPKNPAFCDFLLSRALNYKYPGTDFEPLPDISETEAHDTVLTRIMR